MSAASAKTALITGALGQDGSYLTELLLARGYRVVGTSHRAGANVFGPPTVEWLQLDLGDAQAILNAVKHIQPDEIYNLASRSSSSQLFDDPLATADINGVATVRFLEAIRQVSPHTRFCQAASSEIYAGCSESPQTELTPVQPINAYGASKAYALHMVQAYRREYGLHASTAILFNHESPRRGTHYVTRKIARTVAMIERGLAHELVLGALEIRRDWGFAGDYVHGMWLMTQAPQGDDFVLATGQTHSIQDFCEAAFSSVGLDFEKYVRIDASLVRRREDTQLCGNPEKAERVLGWRRTQGFAQIVGEMVQTDRADLRTQSGK